MTSSSTTAESTSPAAPPPDGKLFVFPWMASRSFDLLWYFAPIVVALGASYLIQNVQGFATGLLFLFVVNAFGIGPAHQGPTWFFYFDKKNREYWSADKKRFLLYYVAPALVFIASVALAVTLPGLGFVLTTLWGIQHFVQQNFGMTLLYHNKNNNEAMPARNLLLRSLWTPTIFFVAMFYYKIFTVPGASTASAASHSAAAVASQAPPMAPWAIGVFGFLGALALFDVVRYLLDMRKQVATGARVNVPAFMFWLVGVLYYIPFIFPGQTIDTVYLIPGTMHWFQYIGLNVILAKQKYKGEERKSDIPCGALVLLAVLCIGSTVFFLFYRGVQQDFAIDSTIFKALMGVYFGLSNVHYFQDAFFWRFREKFQRESIMPYLMQARSTGN